MAKETIGIEGLKENSALRFDKNYSLFQSEDGVYRIFGFGKMAELEDMPGVPVLTKGKVAKIKRIATMLNIESTLELNRDAIDRINAMTPGQMISIPFGYLGSNKSSNIGIYRSEDGYHMIDNDSVPGRDDKELGMTPRTAFAPPEGIVKSLIKFTL